MNARRLLGLGLIAIAIGATIPAQTTKLITINAAGEQAVSDNRSQDISDDGRFVVFLSGASNLVAGDTNGSGDVFVYDRSTGVTLRASVGQGGVEGNGHSGSGSISAHGRFVAFLSEATNLVPGDTNGERDIFVRDLAAGTTTRVNVSAAGEQADRRSDFPSISADGRFVAFASVATNLVPGAASYFPGDVYVRDLATNGIVRASVDDNDVAGNAFSGEPSISADGRFVAFASIAGNLVPGDTNDGADVFLRDLVTGTTTRVSLSSSSSQLVGWSGSASCSGDGGIVLFSYSGGDAVPGDTNGWQDVFARDMVAGTTTIVSVDHLGQPLSVGSSEGRVSADGRHVTFVNSDDGVVPGDTNQVGDVFVRDLQTGALERASVASGGGQSVGGGFGPYISGDGSVRTFFSWARDLDPVDTTTAPDVFVNDANPIFYLYCFGDGSGAACPCGNPSLPGLDLGCANSGGQGASLRASGTPQIAADSVVLQAAGMRNGACLFFQGTTQESSGAGVAFGDGLRCAGGTIRRLAIKLPVGGAAQYPDVSDAPISVRAQCQPGDVRTYQVWYRDVQAFCTPAGHDLTNGLGFYWRL